MGMDFTVLQQDKRKVMVDHSEFTDVGIPIGNVGSFHFGVVMNKCCCECSSTSFVWSYVFISLGHLPSFMELLGL